MPAIAVSARRRLLFFTLSAALVSCASSPSPTEVAVAHHRQVAGFVQLGMSDDSFQTLMAPALTPTETERNPVRFSKDGAMHVVHFLRSQIIRETFKKGTSNDYIDVIHTDDEYTPYTFRDGKLIAVGWEALGGPKFTQADLTKRKASANKSSVNVQQRTTVNPGSSSGGSMFCVPDMDGDGRCFGGPCC